MGNSETHEKRLKEKNSIDFEERSKISRNTNSPARNKKRKRSGTRDEGESMRISLSRMSLNSEGPEDKVEKIQREQENRIDSHAMKALLDEWREETLQRIQLDSQE